MLKDMLVESKLRKGIAPAPNSRDVIIDSTVYEKRVNCDDGQLQFDKLKRLNRIDPEHFVEPLYMVYASCRGPGYTTKKVEGITFEDFVNTIKFGDRRLSEGLLEHIFNQARRALRKIHESGEYHGDINDGNLLIEDPASRKPNVVFIDSDSNSKPISDAQQADLDSLNYLNLQAIAAVRYAETYCTKLEA